MTWFRVDDKFAFHPKAVRAGNEAVGVWVRLGAWSSDQMTDGEIPTDIAMVIANGKQDVLDQLVTARLLVPVEGGYQMHDFLDWNPSAKQVKRQRKADAERKRGLRAPSGKRPAGVRSESASPDPDPDPAPDPRSQKEDPPKAPQGGASGQIGIPFQDSKPEATPIPTSGTRRKSAARGEPKAPLERPAGERYIDAFVLGLADAGITITPPRTSEGAQLGRVAAAHAREGGAPITGDALLAWIRREACAFGKAIARPEMHRGGRTAFGFGTWLDNGRPVQERRGDEPDDDGEHEDPPWPIAPYKPPPPTEPFKPPKATPEQVEAFKRKFVVGASNG